MEPEFWFPVLLFIDVYFPVSTSNIYIKKAKFLCFNRKKKVETKNKVFKTTAQEDRFSQLLADFFNKWVTTQEILLF